MPVIKIKSNMPFNNQFFVTKESLERIKKECAILKNLRLAKSSGEAPSVLHSEDLDPEYISFQQDLSMLDSRIATCSGEIKNAVLIKIPSESQQGIIQIGATVYVELDKTHQDSFTIVGSYDANPALGKISNESPVGKALLGRKVGEEAVISSPIKTRYKIKKIIYS